MPSLTTLAIALAALVIGAVIGFAMSRRPAAKPESANKQDSLLRGAFERSQAGIGYVDADGRWLFVNRKLLQMLGYDTSELMKTQLRQLTHAEDRKREARLFGDLHAGRTAGYTIVKRLLRKSRDYQEYRVVMTRCADAPPVYQCVIQEWISDATGVDNVAEALEDFEEAAVIRCDTTGKITGWNRGAERLFGNTATEVIGSNWTRFHPGNSAVNIQKLSGAAQSGVLQSTEPRLRSDNARINVRSTIVAYGRSRESGGFVEICLPADASQSALDVTRGEIDGLRKEVARYDALEAQLRATIAATRATNAELSRKVRLLANALRKLLTESREKAPAVVAADSPAPPPEAEKLEWVEMTGSDLPGMLQRVVAESRTGTLRLRSDDGETRLMFADGQLVACSSEKDERLLGQLLVDAGIIDDEQRRAAVEAHRANGVPFGNSIVGLGMVTQQDLEDFIRAKTKHELADAAQWEHVKTAFVTSDLPPQSLIPVAIDVLSLVNELSASEITASDRSGRRRSATGRAAVRRSRR
jgi:PAS domain S-box-containing protein